MPVALWAIIIFLFSAMPTSPVSQIHITDFFIKKSAHIFEYAVFTLLLYRALRVSGISNKEAGVYSVILAVLYGASDEFHQSFTPGREPKVRDVFFDTLGALSALYFVRSILPDSPEKIKKIAKYLQIL